jgi:putative salt-induced outer membrane protein YdiY
VNNETALVAPLARQFALKLSYLVRFNNRPPEPELGKSDRFFTAGLQISF